MIKKLLLTSFVFGISATAAMANPAPYVGASIGLTNATSSSYPYAQISGITLTQPSYTRGIPLSVFAGYGGVVNQNFTLGGELTVTLGTAQINNEYGLKTSYGYGASILPGLMLSDHTTAFGRLGAVRTRFSNNSSTQTGAQFGAGIQTTVTQNVDLRGEYIYTAYSSFSNSLGSISSPRSDTVNLALIYKFD